MECDPADLSLLERYKLMIGCVVLFAVAVAALGGLRADVAGGPRDALNLVLALGACTAGSTPGVGMAHPIR